MEHLDRRWSSRVLFLTLLAFLLAASAWADEPVLSIHTQAGLASYALTQIESVFFTGDTLVVVTTERIDAYPLATIEKIDFSVIVTSVQGPDAATFLPKILNLFPNQPNPLSSETKIAFRLPEAGYVALRIYGVSGRLIRTLLSEDRPAGLHVVVWDGLNDSRHRVAPGVYFYKLTAPGIAESRRMVMMH